MISRGERGSGGRAIDPKMCSKPAKGLPGAALMPWAGSFFVTRLRAGFFGLSLVAVGIREIVLRLDTVTSRQGAPANEQPGLTTQSPHRSDDRRHRHVHLGLRRLLPQRKPDHLPRRRALRLHRADDVRGLIRIRQTGRARAGADARLIEQQEQRLGLDAGEGEARSVGEALDGATCAVSAAKASSSAARSSKPSASTGRRVILTPWLSKNAQWLNTAECSTADVMMCRLPGCAARAALIAVLSASVAEPVKTTSLALALTSWATARRAASISAFSFDPKV